MDGWMDGWMGFMLIIVYGINCAFPFFFFFSVFVCIMSKNSFQSLPTIQ